MKRTLDSPGEFMSMPVRNFLRYNKVTFVEFLSFIVILVLSLGFTCEDALKVYFHFCPWKGEDATDNALCNEPSCGPNSCYTPGDTTDPWNTIYEVKKDGKGGAMATFSAHIEGDLLDPTGPEFSVDGKPKTYDVVDHAVVVHKPLSEAPFGGGSRIGCGILKLKSYLN